MSVSSWGGFVVPFRVGREDRSDVSLRHMPRFVSRFVPSSARALT